MKKLIMLCIAAIQCNVFCNGEELNLIEKMSVKKNGIYMTLNTHLKDKKYVTEDFFVEYSDAEMDCTLLDYSTLSMPLILNLITLIWCSGDVYYVDEMDENLFHSLERVKKVFQKLYKHTSWEGQLRPRRLVPSASSIHNNDTIAVLFSQGLDSICTSLRHSEKKQLLLTVWGHSDCPLNFDHVWDLLMHRIIDFGTAFGHENIFFKSNYHRFMDFKYITKTMTPEILSWRIEAVEGLGWIGLTAPILVAKGCKELYIGSSYTWNNPYPQAASPLVDNNIKFADVQIIHDAFEMSRAQKNEYLAQECKRRGLPGMPLRVCARILNANEKSCCKCEKCLRTMTGFLILGEEVRKYGFDISNERAIKRVKKNFRNWKLIDRLAWCWKESQEMARNNMHKLDPLHQNFAAWFIKQNFDQITIFRPVSHINWNDFTELYDQIPAYLLSK